MRSFSFRITSLPDFICAALLSAQRTLRAMEKPGELAIE
jgi:hypothetical protein